MHLRVETAQPYTLFPTKPTFVNHPPPPPSYPYPPQSTLGYHHQYHHQQQPFSNILPYPHQYHPQQYQQQSFSYSNGGNYSNNAATTVKRSSSAFEPLFYQQPQQQQVLPPSPPTTPISNMDQAPTLADFAASIVYLMWHARKPFLLATMKAASPNRHSFSSLPGNASPAFKRFCLQVLTATQLSESAVFLALKYIANLLESNPSIEGAEGSEYRLFIVALMLANKFLDDNTFTNKTWSEVSGMKVQDLNIMESEFLEALEYHLFVREEEYTSWQSTLDTCRQRYIQHQQTPMRSIIPTSLANAQPLQRHEWITSTLHSLGLDKSSSSVGDKHLDDQQQQDYIETDDDDEDDDDDEEEQADQDVDDDDDEEMFQMMHQQHHLRQQEVEQQQQQQQQQQGKQQRSEWPTAAATSTTTRVQLEQSQPSFQLYRTQREHGQYHHPSSMTTPPLSLSSHHRTERPSAFSRHTPDTTGTTRNDTGRSSSFMPYGSSASHHHALQPHRSSSVYRSSTTSVPPGFQRRASPWEPLRDRCGDSFYSHQPFHPYQRQATIAPPSFRTATTGYGA